MARKYARDNRGRFASKGAGATARGGRLRTAAGNKRETQKIAALSGDRMSSVPRGTIGRTRKQREITMIDRPQSQRPAYNAGRAKQQGLIAARKGPGSVSQRQLQVAASKGDRSAIATLNAQRKGPLKPARTDTKGQGWGNGLNQGGAPKRAFAKAPASTIAKPNGAQSKVKLPATATKLGPRINPANKANRAATKKFNQAYERENRIRSSLFRGNKSLATRQAITSELNKASNITATMQQQRREIRGRFDVQIKSKVLKTTASRRPSTISQNKDVRNVANRREAFKRKVNRAASLSRPGNDRKAQRTAQIRSKAMATYQGTRRPDVADSTIGRFGKSRTSTAFRAPASRLASPSKAARRQGRALAVAQKPIRDQFGRRIGNPKKQQRSKTAGARAVKFYQNPKAAAQSVVRDRGKRGLSTRGFKMPRSIRRG